MADKQRIERAQALALANEVIALLAKTVKRAEIAGSIRRKRLYVGDAEIVLKAGEGFRAGTTLDTLCEKLYMEGVFEKRRKTNGALLSWGTRYKAALYKGFAVDLFIVRPDRQWGPTMVLRTGPYEANELLVTQRHKRGILPDDLYWREGAIFRHTGGNREAQLDTPTEADVFAVCELPYIEPEQRTPELYRKLAGSVRGEKREIEPPPKLEQLSLFGDEPTRRIYD